MIIKQDPDILTGYNTFGFDFEYMYERARCISYECESKLYTIGRNIDDTDKFVYKSLSSNAIGDNLIKYIDISGRVNIDLMKIIQRDHK